MRPIKPAASAGDVDTNSTGLGVIVSGVAAVNTMRSFTITGGNGKTLEFSTHFTQVCKPLYSNFRSRHKEHPDCILKMFKNCLSGKTVVDLGRGSGRMRSFKKDLGAFPLAVDVSNTNYPTESRSLPRVYGNYCRPKVINDVLRRVATFPVFVLSGNWNPEGSRDAATVVPLVSIFGNLILAMPGDENTFEAFATHS